MNDEMKFGTEQDGGDEGDFFYMPDFEQPTGIDENDTDGSQTVAKRIISREDKIDTDGREESEPGFFDKIRSFLYLHKFGVLAVLFVAAMVVCVAVFSGGETPADYRVAVYTNITTSKIGLPDALAETLSRWAVDADNDGEVLVVAQQQNAVVNDTSANTAVTVRLMNDIDGGSEYVLFVSDKANYNIIREYRIGETEVFESYDGCPEWIELDAPVFRELFEEYGVEEPLGLSILSKALRDNDQDDQERYDRAVELLGKMREECPEMFECD